MGVNMGRRVGRRGRAGVGGRAVSERYLNEEVGDERGEAEGEEGKEAAPNAGSGVQEGGVHP